MEAMSEIFQGAHVVLSCLAQGLLRSPDAENPLARAHDLPALYYENLRRTY
jgi:hypothetical protein